MAARTLPLLTDLMPAQEDSQPSPTDGSSDKFSLDENASSAVDDVISLKDGDIVVDISLARLMIIGNIGTSYRNLEENIEKLDACDAQKSERMKELMLKLKV